MLENNTQESQNVETNENNNAEPTVKTGVKAGAVAFVISPIGDDIGLIPVHL
jgi:hypothetical protein